MSLEQALAENTAALNRLCSVLQSGALPAGTATATVAAAATAGTATAETAASGKGTRKKADPAATTQPAAAASTAAAGGVTLNDGKSEMPLRLATDPQGTRYFDIRSHRTVAKVVPGEVIPSLPGMEEVNGPRYEVCKNEYAAPVPPTGAAASASAAAPASSTPAAGPASSPASAQPQPPALDGPALTSKCQALHKAQGNPGLKQVLDKFGATNVPGLIAKTAEYPLIAAFIDSLLNPQPAAEPAVENLFG